MLVLALKHDERARLDLPDGRTARVIVLELRGDRVRIGFDVPRDINIGREAQHDGDDERTEQSNKVD